MITLENWSERMGEDMVLRDFRALTQHSYETAVRQFLQWAQTEPEELNEETVRNYILYLREEKKLSASSINVAVCGLRFFFIYLRKARELRLYDCGARNQIPVAGDSMPCGPSYLPTQTWGSPR